MPQLILSPWETPDSIALERAAGQQGWLVERLQSWQASDHLKSQTELVIFGEALFVRFLADQLNIALLEPSPDWLTALSQDYLKRDVRCITLDAARQIDHSAFFKPAGDKAFDAKVYQSGAELPNTDDLPDSLSVLVSEPVSWEVEARCFVLEDTVLTLSPYLREGELIDRSVGGGWINEDEHQAALAFAQDVISAAPDDHPPAFVVDVGLIEGRGWAVLEANPAWASGIYGCDPGCVLKVVKRVCLHRDCLSKLDEQWVLGWESWDA